VKIRLVGWIVFLSATSVAAHHNFRAEFDINSPFSVTGTVTRVEWTNTSMNAGDVVAVDGYKSWDRKNTGNARSVILTKTGQKLFAASSAGQ
jgi:hypothetical protein